jgi:hypothetical protein
MSGLLLWRRLRGSKVRLSFVPKLAIQAGHQSTPREASPVSEADASDGGKAGERQGKMKGRRGLEGFSPSLVSVNAVPKEETGRRSTNRIGFSPSVGDAVLP